jgi:hypothetical protein
METVEIAIKGPEGEILPNAIRRSRLSRMADIAAKNSARTRHSSPTWRFSSSTS